ncbi:MAG: N-acetylmuramoyl-L-alanine amidase [Bacteroidetes bacterium]|nr:N-acetylmuramoyl-L-alanine amidase [Bacteroidota bacterium]
MRAKVVFAVALLYCIPLRAQPQLVPLHVGPNVSYIGGFKDLDHVYVSLNDLAQGLGLNTFVLKSTDKLSVYSSSGSLLFTPSNGFVVVSTQGQTKVLQMPLPVLSANNKLYVPAEYAAEYFSRIIQGRLEYNEEKSELDFSPVAAGLPQITGVQVQPKANGAVIDIGMQSLPKAYEASITSGGLGGEPDMLYVTLMPAAADVQVLDSLPATEVYSQVIAIQNPNSVQLSFALKHKYASKQVFVDSTTNSVIVALYSQADVQKIFSEELKKKLEDEKKNWKLNVIVIDPGHGGKDPGTIGVHGTEEKNVALAIGLDLRSDLHKVLPKVKVVMTRDKDVFVPLDERGEIANQAGGKLFISIHCNSMPHKPDPMHGIETYFLRPGKTTEAIRIAAQENAAIKYENDYEKKYSSYDADNLILTTMAHSAYVKYSEHLAELIETNVSRVAHERDNGVGQAGFYVLIGASMPAVLVETGYLSNVREERFLRSKRGQRLIAKGITDAIVKYKAEYEKNFTQN